ncbi:MAG TPA: SUMF1/EgtB/PvdO family nonheme iron enzyme [Verrucomicrobiae bacterium]|nr:SUMF1/EgtB/PvdO family nonheme iron enzyme [Verrucomicrobiae bacterium]
MNITMVTVPAGEFLRGVNEEDAHEAEESPQIVTWVEEYQIQKYPVTVEQWLEFLALSHYKWPKEEWIKVCKETGAMPELREDVPITYVNWFDAKAFADWLAANTGVNYSLPSENQWEKACRGCRGQPYPWGNVMPAFIDDLLSQADPSGNFLLQPVGRHKDKASPFGCEDMCNNVSEWCDDWFLLEFSEPTNADNDVLRECKACRGGNVLTSGWPRCTAREAVDPKLRSHILGFRLVARSVKQQQSR